MEKKRPHYPLSLIHDLAHYPEKVRYTDSAVKGAHQLGLTTAGIRNVVINLQPKDFYKSMTTYADPSIWQDVYHPKISGITIYVKITIAIAERVLIVSFKRK